MNREVLVGIRAICEQSDVPLTLVENTTGFYRTGLGPWLADAWSVNPDAVICFPGGQLGLAFTNDRYYVSDKLTLISTWDGDEVSLTRLCWELRIARASNIAATSQALREALERLGPVEGLGLYLRVTVNEPSVVQAKLHAAGIRVGLRGDSLVIAPPLNLGATEVKTLRRVLNENF